MFISNVAKQAWHDWHIFWSVFNGELIDLQKELKRREAALAETAALLVLRKKAQAIWGDPEDE